MSTKSYSEVELPEGKLDEVQITIQDKLQYERTARAQKWPSDIQENMFTFAAFVAWHATKRAGKHNLKWEEFIATALEATVRHETEEDGDDSDLAQS